MYLHQAPSSEIFSLNILTEKELVHQHISETSLSDRGPSVFQVITFAS